MIKSKKNSIESSIDLPSYNQQFKLKTTTKSIKQNYFKLIMLTSCLTLLLLTQFTYSTKQFLFFSSSINNQLEPLNSFDSISTTATIQSLNLDKLWLEGRKPKIAIIGGGAGGSSAAYFLKHFSDLGLGLDSEVTLFESSNYIGGRSTICWPWLKDAYSTPIDSKDDPVELGASIFIKGNKNLWKATRFFNLTTIDHSGEDEGAFGLWNGNDIFYSQSAGTIWNTVKLFWRYGRTPMRAQALVKSTVGSFTSLYTSAFVSKGPFTSLKSFANSTSLLEPLSTTSQSYFTANGVNPLFTNELISAASTVNYGTPSSKIHGVGALVSLAADGALSIEGGNRKIFQNFLKASNAEVRMGKEGTVEEIMRLDNGFSLEEGSSRPQWVVKPKIGSGGTFDVIIFAAPFHQTSINLINTNAASLIPKQDYVNLHVTFVITNSTNPSSSYFNLSPKTKINKSIFSTFDSPNSKFPNAFPEFNSLNYLRELSVEVGESFGGIGTYHVVKIFSDKELKNESIYKLFENEANVGKVFRKTWAAYPLLLPIEDLAEEEILVGATKESLINSQLSEIKLDEGFYYVNGFERIISTMETETVSAFNVVGLILQEFFGYIAPTSWAEWDY